MTLSGQCAATCWCTALIISTCCPFAPIVHAMFCNLVGSTSRTLRVLLTALLHSSCLGATHTWLTRQIDFRSVMGWALSIVEDRFACRFTALIISACCRLAPIVHVAFWNLMGFTSRARWVLLTALVHCSCLGATNTGCVLQVDTCRVVHWAVSTSKGRLAGLRATFL